MSQIRVDKNGLFVNPGFHDQNPVRSLIMAAPEIKKHTQTAFSPKMMTANSWLGFHFDFWAINHFSTCLVLLILVSLWEAKVKKVMY